MAKHGSPAIPTTAVLWRGFEHHWGYNHRLNRLGNMVETEQTGSVPQGFELFHAAASGSGKDNAWYRSYYTIVSSSAVAVQTGIESFQLVGQEDQFINHEVNVSVPALPTTRNRDHYVAVLNGFDMCAVEDADKLEFFRLNVSATKYDSATDTIRLRIAMRVRLNCKSVECDKGTDLHYRVRVAWLVFAGDEGEFAATPNLIRVTHSWKAAGAYPRINEPFLEPHAEMIRAGSGGSPQFPVAALGIAAIQVDLQGKDHWMAAWHSAVRPGIYRPEAGEHDFELDLFFKQWNGLTSLKTVSLTAKGEAEWSANIVLLQFAAGRVVHLEHINSLVWNATGKGACVPQAERRHRLEFKLDAASLPKRGAGAAQKKPLITNRGGAATKRSVVKKVRRK
jgi:hypothetical protein